MKSKCIYGMAIIAVLSFGLALARENTSERIEESFRFANPQAENLLVVDNVWGDIVVTGCDGQEVHIKAVKSVSARSNDAREEIDKEVYLDIDREDDRLELYVDGPFRDEEGRSRRRGRRWSRHYEVRYDFDIQVPRGTYIKLNTVNDGEIRVRDVAGDYDIHNVNGGIEMEKIGGSGEVYTVNGDVNIDFVKNPMKNSRFGSLNGEVRLYFLPSLSADFYLKTFNGEIYSDFPVSYLPLKTESRSEKKRSGYVYKVNRQTAVRAGEGGPEIKLDGFNWDVFILEKK